MDLFDKKMGGLTVQTSPQLERAGVLHGFTTRFGGVSEGIWASLNLGKGRGDAPERVRENYGRVCAALGLRIDRMVLAVQVHGNGVRTVTGADAGCGLDRRPEYEADALITDVPGLPLVGFGADCLTILFHDPVRQAVGVAHAGWRGTALGIAARTVEQMTRCYGTRPEDLLCALGPCIDRCCFETGEEVPAAMTAALGAEAAPFVTDDRNGKYHVDLKGLNTLWLTRSGVERERIDLSPDCTLCLHEKYWSHRYTKGQRGSQASLICLPEMKP